MVSLICEIYTTIQMKITTKNRNRLTDPENRLVVAKAGCGERGGEGRIGSLGLADANYYI